MAVLQQGPGFTLLCKGTSATRSYRDPEGGIPRRGAWIAKGYQDIMPGDDSGQWVFINYYGHSIV